MAQATEPRYQLQSVMSYENALTVVDRLADGLGKAIDEKIRPLVAVMIMCDIETRMSCEGHATRSRPHPWVTVSLGQEAKLNCLLGWQNRPGPANNPNHNQWVLESHPHGWCVTPRNLDQPLDVLQRYALEFAERIQLMLNISR